VICLKLLSKSREDGETRACIGVGYNTGCLRFFSQDGTLLISQYLHNEPIRSLRLRSSHFKASEGEEELTIHFSDVVVSIEGTSLYASLKSCLRNILQGPPPPQLPLVLPLFSIQSLPLLIPYAVLTTHPFFPLTLTTRRGQGSPSSLIQEMEYRLPRGGQ